MRHDGIVHIDLRLRTWVAHHQVHWLNETLSGVISVVSPPVDIVVVLVFFLWRRRSRFRAAAITVLLTQAAVIVVKAAVGRPTPLHPSRFYGDFPSGHTAMFMTCAGVVIVLSDLSTERARRWWALVGVGTLAVMSDLIYIQGHWLSDTLASVCFATVALWMLAVTRSASDR